MEPKQYAERIVLELKNAAEQLPQESAERLVERILQADKIFLAGAGRSGLMAEAFAMRLMHLGFQAYVVGETVTPGFDSGDLLLIGSGSGETRSLVVMAEKAESLGGDVALATIQPDSAIGRRAELVIQLPGAPKDKSGKDAGTIQPMGTLFEQTLLIFFDAVILRLMEKQGQDTKTMYGKHANLE